MKAIRVGVIGVGHLGSIHARIYSELQSAQLVEVCDLLADRAEAAAHRYGCLATTDFRDLLGKVEAVSIAVPTQEHFRVAKPFLLKGIHALVEKPFTRTVREADALLRMAAKSQAILQVGHVERFNAALRKVSDTLKDPRFIEVHRLAPFQPRGTEVGVVLDLMIHDIDLLLGLIRNPIRRLEAVGVNVLTPFEDIANARITFQNGVVANLTASRISKEGMRKFRIFQQDAYISIDLLGQSVDIFRHVDHRITHENLPIPREEPLKSELFAFLESIAHHLPPPISAQEARDALAVALKITKQIHRLRPS